MQENADYTSDPSQSGQDDSPNIFLHSSKLRKRLEKLAQWRINPSLIEFPVDAREFRGGFATVSQGFLASSSRTEGGANESKHLTDEPPSLADVDSQPDEGLQQPQPRTEGKNEDVRSRKADCRNGLSEEEESKEPNTDEEHRSPRQPPIPDIGNEASTSHHIVNEDPDLGDRNHQSHKNTEGVENDEQGEGERSARGIANGNNDEAKEEAEDEGKNGNEGQLSDRQTLKQVGDGSASER
ncbi:hypothetical protein FS837_012366 [Tulasnella sp. UAMH 9824]|nr:hypothetical protein FS837_012366 [Tulasnella sp. UAMH 9824]